jgi:signal transduction histidine kinase
VSIEVAAMPVETELAGDPERIARAVRNLLENAIRYGPERGRIGMELTCNEDGAVTLAVVDEGPGIDPRYRDRVFESYFRINETADEGTGLGLAIVSEIAKQHGATVTVADGDGGKGTRMVVRFPVPADVRRRRPQVAATA